MCWWAKNTAAGYVPDISISFEMCIFLIAVNESLEEKKKLFWEIHRITTWKYGTTQTWISLGAIKYFSEYKILTYGHFCNTLWWEDWIGLVLARPTDARSIWIREGCCQELQFNAIRLKKILCLEWKLLWLLSVNFLDMDTDSLSESHVLASPIHLLHHHPFVDFITLYTLLPEYLLYCCNIHYGHWRSPPDNKHKDMGGNMLLLLSTYMVVLFKRGWAMWTSYPPNGGQS